MKMTRKIVLLFALAVPMASTSALPARADSPQEERRDRAADRIEDAFERDGILRRFDLDADSEGDRTGYIELEGRVNTSVQRARALSIARRIAPSYRIVNRIRLR